MSISTQWFLTILALILGLGLTLALLAGLHTARAAPTATDQFVTTTGSGSACTQAVPCALQTALISATNSDTIYVAGGVHTGTCVAVITLTKSITLSGGWDGAVGGLVVRDPAAYPTTLDGERARRVVYISGNITPTVDGFIVTRGNATTVYCPFVGGCSSIYVLEAHPVIAHDVITDNIVAVFTNASGYGGEMFLRDATRAIIHSNLITSNAASTAYWGFGGGMWIGGEGSGLQVSFNQVFSNAAKTANMYGEGGGIHSGPDEALIQGNVIAGNRTSSNAVIGRGAGLVQLYGSTRYPGNLVQGNAGPYAVHLYHNQARFEGNRVVDNNTVGGVCLESGAGAGPLLVNNVVASNWTCAVYAQDGASGILTATLIHNTLVGAGAGYGVYGQYAALVLTNTIVASTTWGITNNTPASTTIQADHTLFYNAPNHAGSGVVSTDEITGDPRFVDPADGDFHIGAGSAAIDAGVDAGVTTDIDGDPRPIGPTSDVGADEWCLRVYLPLVMR